VIKVHCLYRVSTKKQVDVLSDDIPMQRIACREFAERQNGWVIVKEHEEKGVSGSKVSANDRDAVQELRKAAENGEFDVLLVFMFDRLGRIEGETPFVVKELTEHGIAVWSVKEGEQRFDSHVDSLMNYIRFWQADGESKKISMRVKERMGQLVEAGEYTGGVAPFGYELVRKGRLNKKGEVCYDLAVNETEAQFVRNLFTKTVRDGYGSHRLAEWLNKQGISTHSGAKFKSNTINRILRRPIYTGCRNIGTPKNAELAIIDEALFQEAQRIIDQRDRANDEKRTISLNTSGNTLLSGNVWCKACQCRISSTSYTDKYTMKDGTVKEKKFHRYLCWHKSRKLNECDGQSAYIAERIDNAVLAIVRDMFSQIKEQPETEALERKIQAQTKSLTNRSKSLTADLAKNVKQLEKLQLEIAGSLTGDSVFTAEDLSNAIKTVKGKIAESERELSDVEIEIKSLEDSKANIAVMYRNFLGWADEFDNATLEQKKMIVGQLIKRVELDRGYKVHIEFNLDYEQFCEDFGQFGQ